MSAITPKCFISSLLLFFSIGVARGQQFPLFGSYQQLGFLYNPAIFNETDYYNLILCPDKDINSLNTSVIYRNQWNRFGGSSGIEPPQTYGFFGHGNFRQASVGFILFNEHISFVDNTFLQLNYSYTFRMTEQSSLSFGLNSGFYQLSLDQSQLRLSHPLASDIVLLTAVNGLFLPVFSFGLVFRQDIKNPYLLFKRTHPLQFQLGFSVFHLNPQQVVDRSFLELQSQGGYIHLLNSHYFAFFKMRLLNGQCIHNFSTLFKYVAPSILQLDISYQYLPDHTPVWIGLAVRKTVDVNIGLQGGVSVKNKDRETNWTIGLHWEPPAFWNTSRFLGHSFELFLTHKAEWRVKKKGRARKRRKRLKQTN